MSSSSSSSSSLAVVLESKIACCLQNWELQRPYNAPLSKRSEGFTERWGIGHEDLVRQRLKEEQKQQEDGGSSGSGGGGDGGRFGQCWLQEQASIEDMMATEHPALPLRLYQYRPAWAEQLTLRIAGLPHVVINSHYAVLEATGPLPCLQDFRSYPPAMTGRMSGSSPTQSALNNAILDYLHVTHKIELDEAIPEEKLRQQAHLFTLLVRQQLEPCLAVLRYQESRAWCQIHRRQCLSAGGAWWGWGFFSSWQAWSERVQTLVGLGGEIRQLTIQKALATLRQACQDIEDQLSLMKQRKDASSSDNQTFYLLGTAKPTYVDVLLWDFVMTALAELHVGPVLAEFPVLLRYTETMWNKYFVAGPSSSGDWHRWNQRENTRNAFSQSPLVNFAKSPDGGKAVEVPGIILHRLFLQDASLQERLKMAKGINLVTYDACVEKQVPKSTWYRWRMGGSFFPPTPSQTIPSAAKSTDENDPDQNLRRTYQRHDEIWMSVVTTATIASLVAFGLFSSVERPRG